MTDEEKQKIELGKKLIKQTYNRIPLVAFILSGMFYLIIYVPIGCASLMGGAVDSDAWRNYGWFFIFGMYVIFYIVAYAILTIYANVKTKHAKEEIIKLEQK